jgi:3-oxoacyl-(acyl-carrier-protein) synthase
MTATSAVTRTGLGTLAEAAWPEPGDGPPPPIAGFIVSTFSPLVAAAAERCLSRAPLVPYRTAVVIVTVRGDVASARHVAGAVDAGARIGPLLFFQSVPNAVAGHLAARHGLDGPVVCLSPAADPLAEGLAEAALLIADEDLDAALVVVADQDPDLAHALLVRPGGHS